MSVPTIGRMMAFERLLQNDAIMLPYYQKRGGWGIWLAKVLNRPYQLTRQDTAYTKTLDFLPITWKYAQLNKIGGRTIIWNQQVHNGDFEEDTVWSVGDGGTKTIADGMLTLTCTATTATRTGCRINSYAHTGVKDHLIYVTCQIKASVIREIRIGDGGGTGYFLSSGYYYAFTPTAVDTWFDMSAIIKQAAPDANGKASFKIVYWFAENGEVLQIRNAMCIDLTAMFGSGNEPTTAAEFKAMFPADYYSFDAGTLTSAGVTSIVSKNADDTTLDTYTIPAAVQALPGYGWSCPGKANTVDISAKIYVQNVGSRAYVAGDDADATVVTDKTTTYYALAEPVETDISAYLTDSNILDVEAGGLITFSNTLGDDYRIPVPSTIEYQRRI